MGAVFIDMAISLDGFVAGPDNTDSGLHDWYFAPEGNAVGVIAELFETIGAMIIGRNMVGDEEGFDTPYHVPHIVLTHRPRPSVERSGASFIFVADGLTSALATAQAAAGNKLVCIAGGADTVRQFLNAGLVDEVRLHVVPRLIGGGLRLFDGVVPLLLEPIGAIESPAVTHLRYRVLK